MWLLIQVLTVMVTLGFASSLHAQQQWEIPSPEERCPSRWGQDDRLGSANLQSPERVLRAARLIRTGDVFSLAFELSADLPLLEPRRFDVHMKRGTSLTPGSRGENEEIVITELGQVGTQLDGFAHQMLGGLYYNCVTDAEMSRRGTGLQAGGRPGFAMLGVEQIPDMMTRGVLIDVAGLKGVDMLPAGYVITVDDLQQALARASVTLEEGDAVMIHTGWGRLYTVEDKDRYLASSPGIGIEAAQWLIGHNPILLGADNCCLEARPYPEQKVFLPVHALVLIINGIYIVENLNLSQLATERVYESAFIMEILKIKGGTGSTVAPIAVR